MADPIPDRYVDDPREAAIRWRGVEEPCDTCVGMGVRSYSSTAGWAGGVGGSMMTMGTCDACWGSGDAGLPGVDLRRLTAEVGRLRATLLALWRTYSSVGGVDGRVSLRGALGLPADAGHDDIDAALRALVPAPQAPEGVEVGGEVVDGD